MSCEKRILVGSLLCMVCVPFLLGGCPPTTGGTTQTGSCCASDGTCTVTIQSSCTGTWTSGGTCSPNPCASAVTPQLFIANILGNSVTSYLNPKTVNGNVAPNTNLAGAQTQLNHPSDIVVTANGLLLACNFSAVPASVTTYSNAATANGNIAPARNVQGATTNLAGPTTLAITSGDLLFVANGVASPASINVFSSASTASFNGNLPPTRTISSAALNFPFGINFGANDELYVANNADGKIHVFANASNLNGTVSPSRTLTNAAFADVYDCFIDKDDRLYVVTGSSGGANKNKVFVINNASTKNGAVTVDSTLTVTGATFLSAIAVDKSLTGYVVDRGVGTGAVYAFDNINTRNGAFAPDRSITGATTQLNSPIRVFLVE